ncbi:hypothetical protein [Actinomyces mediterranea]|uniref:hypothetical protein n=1 Tax=Actinomyces mediterranea TaxID=1871028 RepID=UPI000970FEFF|nr:hypothetical protein [Actinomyces mediterranea]
MTSLPRLIDDLAANRSPALTVYSAERVELNGPVLARWLAKTANLLRNEFDPDLFGPTDAPARIHVRVGLWQDLIWMLAARAMGWLSANDAADLSVGDLLVISEIDEDAASAAERGVVILAQQQDFLAFSWAGGELGGGIDDALTALMAQSDSLEVCVPADAPSIEQIAPHPVRAASSQRWCASTRTDTLSAAVGAWCAGAGLVLVDHMVYSSDDIRRIAHFEGALLIDG